MLRAVRRCSRGFDSRQATGGASSPALPALGAWTRLPRLVTNVLAMFSSNTTFQPVHNPVESEVCFSFWGFVPSDDARWKLLEFFSWSMHRRMYMTDSRRTG